MVSGAVEGSKFDGTGFEKEQIGHIHVPVLLGKGSELGRWKGLSARAGDAVALLEGPLRLDTPRVCIDDRLVGLGTRVILAEDLRKPACRIVRLSAPSQHYSQTHIKFISVYILKINGYGVLPRIFIVDIADSVGGQVDLAILIIRNLELPVVILVSVCCV
jgi:hypothetical protein